MASIPRATRSSRFAALVVVGAIVAACGGGDDDATTSTDAASESAATGDDLVALFAEQLAAQAGLQIDDATCLSEIVVADLPDLIVYEDGEFVEPPDTPEINERLLESLTRAEEECGLDRLGG